MEVTRRSFLAAASAFAGTIAAPTKSSGAAAESFADPEAAASWMAETIKNSERAPSGVLRLSRFVEAIWFLTAPIGWRPNPGQEKLLGAFEIPAGFVTDLASIPRVFWQVLPRDGEYAYAAIIHDYLYWTHICDRSTADEIFDRPWSISVCHHGKLLQCTMESALGVEVLGTRIVAFTNRASAVS